MKKSAIILCALLNVCFLYSQNTISGKILDESNNPLAFANIVLYKSNTESIVTGAISDDNGFYQFNDISEGNYSLEISVLGFTIEKSSVFSFSDKNRISLDFVLIEETHSLNEVVVTGTRPTIRQIGEKLVINLEQSEMVNSNLKDVMKKVPGIIVTNGSITYGGQEGVRVLINGKTTDYMDISSLLRDLPAEHITKVELIHQPGAEFDAEGSGPLINIILKKNFKLGTNGNIKLYTGYDNEAEYGISGAVAGYNNQLNWQLSAGYRKSAWREDLFISRKVNDQIYDQSTISPFSPETLRFNGGIDYNIDVHHTVGILTSVINTKSDRISSNSTSISEEGSSQDLFTENKFDRDRITFTINPYYKFENEKNELILDFNYVDYKNNNINKLFGIGDSPIPYENQKYFQDSKYQISTFKGDYKYTIDEDFNWMIGAKYSMVTTDSELQSFTQNTAGDFILDTTQSNRFLVDENILAIYLKIMKKWQSWSFSGGLRWENSDTQGTSINPAETKSRSISKVFPSANIGKKINEKFGTNLSYSYRILRPSYNSLNAFVYYYDPYTFEQGNPNLKPEFTNSLQFDFTYENQPFLSVGYKNTRDALFEIITQDDVTAQTSRSVINLANRENWNFRAFAPLNLTDEMSGYSGLIINYNKFESNNLNPKLNLDKWSLTWYTNIEYKLPWNINSELTMYYSSGGLQGQIEHSWLAGLNFAVGKTILEDKLKINLGIDEVFNRKFKGIIQYDNIDADIISDWSRQNIYFQLTYNFGSKFRSEKEKRNPSEEEQDRILDNN